MDPLEIAANAIYLAAILLAARNHWISWIFGIIGCTLFGFLYFDAKLYSSVTLQGFFIITNLIGLWMWTRPSENRPERPITAMHWKTIWMMIVPAAIVVAVGFGTYLTKTTDANFPVMDTLLLSLSVAAQFLLMGRKSQTWLFWIAVNAIGIPLYASQGLHLTSLVYCLFLINAVYGYFNWKKQMQMPDTANSMG